MDLGFLRGPGFAGRMISSRFHSLASCSPLEAVLPDTTFQQIADARTIFQAAVCAVQPDRLLGDHAWWTWARRPLDQYRRIVVAGMGKAALGMGQAVEKRLGALLTEGVVVVPQSNSTTPTDVQRLPRGLEVLEGSHPLPGRASVTAARRVLRLAQDCDEHDLLIVLISGGGTALCADFVEGVSLEDAQTTFQLLLEAGAEIHAVNTVRKHISRIGGGQLAAAAAPAEILSLVISDVVGDDLSVIASGPTVPDPSTFAETIDILRIFGLWGRVPRSVRIHLEAGLSDPSLETPKPGAPPFEHTRCELIGTNRTALQAAAEQARALGYSTYVLAGNVTGEAREVGKRLAQEARAITGEGPVCLIWGGETTVTVRGQGRGGRNQELALAAALALEGSRRSIVFLSGGTDGRDGPTDAAGAWVTHRTARNAREAGLLPELYLADNDSYTFFEKAGSLLLTGPTHTNVMDVQIALIRPA